MKRNFFILLGGGAVAQAITFASLPILGRLYEPVSFGYLAGAMSIASICAVVLHGRYHMAIPVAQDPADPPILLWLSVMLSLSLVVPVVLLVAALTGNGWVDTGFSVFLATCVVLAVGAALLDISSYWLSYRHRFKLIAVVQSLRTLFTSAAQICFAPLTAFGMVIGAFCGLWAALGWIVFHRSRKSDIAISWPGWRQLAAVAKRYRYFPLYGTPQGLLAAASWNLLPLLLLRAEGPIFAGLYWAAYRILITPLALFNSSYRQATLRALGDMSHHQALLVARRHTATLVVTGGAVALLIVASEDFLFPILMGPGWDGAAVFASALSLGMAAELFKVPAICFLQSQHRQKSLLFCEVGIFLLRYIPTLALIEAGHTELAIKAFALVGLAGWTAFSLHALFFTSPSKE
jgi:O-antigen/teichoic acid export membrane protein